MQKRILEIDGENTTSLEAFYDEVGRRIIPGATWGRNLDAFNDILRGGFGTPEEGFVLRWNSSEASRQCLGYAETVRYLQQKLQTCHSASRRHVSVELAAAERSEGPTLFDRLVEIIEDHEDIELVLL